MPGRRPPRRPRASSRPPRPARCRSERRSVDDPRPGVVARGRSVGIAHGPTITQACYHWIPLIRSDAIPALTTKDCIMIVITGATGALNGATVDHLLRARCPPGRSPSPCATSAKAQRFAERGVEVRHGDYADPASLPARSRAPTSCCSCPRTTRAPTPSSLHRTAIDAAVARAASGRILYTSHQGAALDSPFQPARDHAATEQLLADVRRGLDLAAQRLLRPQPRLARRPWRETGVDRRAGRRPGVLDSPRGRRRGGRRRSWPRTAPTTVRRPSTAERRPDLRGRSPSIASEVVRPDGRAGGASDPHGVARHPGRRRSAASGWRASRSASTRLPPAGFPSPAGPLLGDLLGREPRSVRELVLTRAVSRPRRTAGRRRRRDRGRCSPSR